LLAGKHERTLAANAKNKILSPLIKTHFPPKNTSVIGVNNADAMLTGIALQMQQDMTYLRFLLNRNALYQVSSDASRHELTIIFENTRLVAALPKINYSGSGIEDIHAFKNESGNLKLVLRLNAMADIKRLELSETGKAPELQLDILCNNPIEVISHHPVAARTIPVTIKRPVAENTAEQEYQRALQLVSIGDTLEAARILRELLVVSPEDKKAREYLTTLLVQQGKKVEANKILDVGLSLQSDSPALLKLKARLLVEEGKTEAALTLLEKISPQMSSDPEYYAFVAALYQRQGQVSLAGNLYKQLLALQPSNAKWWVGLGIALEASGDHSQAFDAYANADSIGGLDPELKSYLATRLHTT
jgi:Flp pilus assembly protein TadD